MSEHQHDLHDCSSVIEQVYAFHDNELSAEEADEIREHLMACEPCLDRFQVEEAMRVLIRRCCREDLAPDGLRVRLQAKFSVEQDVD
ncbi:mycothiol system anti-sigma-R factor [Propionicimonas paludicola]|uniref:Mycothiol system anti-sigma-R factor n=1 Tax=Propionicimonas paludicola TaxID=185243 RepID=A0A2A9CQZ0_9ACTN|nr:mycothiol system anti-sigma-R factor [Propionicimonas paludicola]PFG16833.1 mycothiol system anti-sigma-R factor [Propionicimonas paludicola]